MNDLSLMNCRQPIPKIVPEQTVRIRPQQMFIVHADIFLAISQQIPGTTISLISIKGK
jgi:hypothetical protein